MIITLCGSTKFKEEFEAKNKELSLQGHVVLSVAYFGHRDPIPLTSYQKTILDDVHKSKIDLSEAIYVLNVGGYIGDSTKSEISYAEKLGKTVIYHVPVEVSPSPTEKIVPSCQLCSSCGYEPDADYPVCYHTDCGGRLGLSIIHAWKQCKGEYFSPHPARVKWTT